MDGNPVFISYSREDWDQYVNPLVEHLRKQGITTWVDQHLLEGGDDWLDRINDALDSCSCMVLCVSPEALTSKYVKMEYRYFIDEDKPIIPVICREAKLPAELRRLQHLAFSDLSLVVQRLKKLLQIEPENSSSYYVTHSLAVESLTAQEYFDRARARQKTDLDGKIADYSQAIKLDPKYVDAYINRGIAQAAEAKYDAAIGDFSQAIKLAPQSPEAYLHRGNARKNIDDIDGAIADFTEAIRLDPQHVDAYIGRGNTYNRQRENGKAAADFRKALELQPDHRDARVMQDYIKWWEKNE
jgi:tetratricopeptide (TPR) repeat protein